MRGALVLVFQSLFQSLIGIYTQPPLYPIYITTFASGDVFVLQIKNGTLSECEAINRLTTNLKTQEGLARAIKFIRSHICWLMILLK